VTFLRGVATAAFVLAIASRLARPYISFGLATRITPEVHKEVISGDNFVFWGLLALGATLLVISFLRQQ
jgi:hypothetical protein